MIECEEYELILNDGTNYKVICSSIELDKLISLIGETNIIEIKE